jgi:putative phosphoesterase
VPRIERVGIVADTHGSLLPDVTRALESAGVGLILHAGDIGSERVLAALEQVAPVVAVSGNGDEPLYHRFPWDLCLTLEGRRVLLCHWYDNFGRIHPRYARIVSEWRPDALVYGHTHQALRERRGETLFLNPGYAGPPEPSRTRSIATLELETLEARIVELPAPATA